MSFIPKDHYTKDELIACSNGELFVKDGDGKRWVQVGGTSYLMATGIPTQKIKSHSKKKRFLPTRAWVGWLDDMASINIR